MGNRTQRSVKILVDRMFRSGERKSHEQRSGITLQVLLEELENWAPAFSPQGIAISNLICRSLFPLCRITLEEVPSALEQVEWIKKHCSHMVVSDIYELERQLKALQAEHGNV